MSLDRDYTHVRLLKREGHMHYYRDIVTGEEFCELATPGDELGPVQDDYESRVVLYVEFAQEPSAAEIMSLRKFSSNLSSMSIVDLKRATQPGKRLHIKECNLVQAEGEIMLGAELGIALRFDLVG